ncbi:MAG: class I adenylate-forming enzyme family protein [Acidimicrobiales bacterium]
MTGRQISGAFETVVDLFRAGAIDNRDVEAYVEPSSSGSARQALTFAEWERAADGVAALFTERGVARGSVVCLLLPSSIDYMVCYAAALRLGAITSGINLRLGAEEQRSILARTAPAVTVVENGAPRTSGAGSVVTRSEVVAARSRPPLGTAARLDPSDPVAVVWTSGTSGLPKGAVFDHRSLRAVADGTDALSAPGDRRLSPLPFAHVGSMTRIWDELAKGITTVITPTPWKAGEAISVMADERITVGQGVPTQWALVLAHPDVGRADLSSLRVAGTGASRVPPELVAEMRARLGVPVVVRYTSTEASLGTGTSPGDPDQAVATTVGRPVPGVSLEIVDDTGAPVAVGEVGRVRLRSPAAMVGYWGGPPMRAGAAGVVFDEAATAAVLSPDGWLTTGDFGRLDEEGRLHLAGRANELYIRGGYNVYPAEVESVLTAHRRVEQAAVVGVPDPVLGEIGVAYVVVNDGPPLDSEELLGELRELCHGTLADYKAPDRVIVEPELPLTSMMKVDKAALAEQVGHETNGVRAS